MQQFHLSIYYVRTGVTTVKITMFCLEFKFIYILFYLQILRKHTHFWCEWCLIFSHFYSFPNCLCVCLYHVNSIKKGSSGCSLKVLWGDWHWLTWVSQKSSVTLGEVCNYFVSIEWSLFWIVWLFIADLFPFLITNHTYQQQRRLSEVLSHVQKEWSYCQMKNKYIIGEENKILSLARMYS